VGSELDINQLNKTFGLLHLVFVLTFDNESVVWICHSLFSELGLRQFDSIVWETDIFFHKVIVLFHIFLMIFGSINIDIDSQIVLNYFFAFEEELKRTVLDNIHFEDQ